MADADTSGAMAVSDIAAYRSLTIDGHGSVHPEPEIHEPEIHMQSVMPLRIIELNDGR